MYLVPYTADDATLANRWRSEVFTGSQGPSLVVVAGSALPDLHLVAVGRAAVREVEAEALVLKRDPIISRVVPLLRRKVVVALPNLHPSAVGRS